MLSEKVSIFIPGGNPDIDEFQAMDGAWLSPPKNCGLEPYLRNLADGVSEIYEDAKDFSLVVVFHREDGKDGMD